MANYSIQRSDVANGDITVTEATANTTTNATLVGQNFTGYGDEIATNFLQHMEHFASATAPEANARVPGSAAIQGQLWYDSTALGVLKVNNGASWDEIAKLDLGTQDDAVARYNSASGKWIEETRVRVTTSGTLEVRDLAETSFVTFNHGGTNLAITGTGTTDIDVTGIVAMNIPSVTLTTALAETDGGTGTDTYVTGDILYADGANSLVKLAVGSNGELLTLAGGVPTWAAAGASVSALNDLSDVDTAGVVTGSLIFKTAGDWTDSPGLTWNGTTLNATQYNSIVAANLIDRTAPGTISGTETHTADIAMSGADITLTTSDVISWGVDSSITDDGTNLVVDGGGTSAFLLMQNFTGPLFLQSSQVWVDGVSGGEFLRLQSDSDLSSATTFINFRNNSGTVLGQVGMTSASSNALRIHGTSAGVEIIGTDANIKFDTGAAGTIFRAYNAANEVSVNTATVGSLAKTSRMAIYNDINAGVNGYSVGYNETPQANGGALSAGGTYNISIDDAGLFLTRTTSSATTIDFGTLVSAPIGFTVLVHNDNTGTCTIHPSGGMGLEWIDGVTAIAPSGDRTLAANSIATVRKKAGGLWQIWGNGLS